MRGFEGDEQESHPLVGQGGSRSAVSGGSGGRDVDDFDEEEQWWEIRSIQKRRPDRGRDHPLHYLRRSLPSTTGGKYAGLIFVVGFLLLIATAQYRSQPVVELGQIELAHTDNPYFWTGDVWKHNDEVSARLDRCAELGLLRNTADVLLPLPQDEEAAAIAEGCGTNQTTVIILSSIYMAEVFGNGSWANAGESIYAQSVISTVNRWGYSYLFSSLGQFNHDMRKTMDYYRRHRNQVRMVLADPEQAELCWRNAGQKCLKTEDNEDGLPAWRLLSFWYWDDSGNPLGRSFTLSPTPTNENHFLSYSIEPSCRRLKFLPHDQRVPHQAYLLAKQIRYFEQPAFSWTLKAFTEMQTDLGVRVVGGMKNDDEGLMTAVEAAGITNLGILSKIDFLDQLARSFVLIGVGQPRISPSPWDALCMGVPFINPILEWDESDPDNRTKWHAQQWRMTHLKPPYVYSVKAHDLAGLHAAVKAALENPIQSFIPDYMKFDFACDKMAELLEIDWREKAREILDERIRSGNGEVRVELMIEMVDKADKQIFVL